MCNINNKLTGLAVTPACPDRCHLVSEYDCFVQRCRSEYLHYRLLVDS